MGRTYYSDIPSKHDSLGLDSYLHASSPIRRYADLLVHYQINRYLNNNELIPIVDIQSTINELNYLSRQNANKYREDQNILINKWFQDNKDNNFSACVLNWIHKTKNLCTLYFLDYKFSSICFLKSKLLINLGEKIQVKNLTTDYSDKLCFQLI